jgi:hypothetical protein
LIQFVVLLQIKPEFRTVIEIPRQAQSCVGGDAAPPSISAGKYFTYTGLIGRLDCPLAISLTLAALKITQYGISQSLLLSRKLLLLIRKIRNQ